MSIDFFYYKMGVFVFWFFFKSKKICLFIVWFKIFRELFVVYRIVVDFRVYKVFYILVLV